MIESGKFNVIRMLMALAAAAPALAQPVLTNEPDRRSLLSEMRGWKQAADIDILPMVMEQPVGCAKERIYMERWAAGRGPNGAVTPPPGFGDRGPGVTDPTDVLNNTLDIEVAPPGNGLTGSNIMTIRSNVNNLTSFKFLLRWNFAVTTCTVAGPGYSYTVTPTVPFSGSNPASYGRTFNFDPLHPINQGDIFTVRVDYTGTLVEGIGLGSVVVGPQNNTNGNPGVICTLSEPYYAATWWPCKDGDVFQLGDNSDKATLNMSITAPQNFTSVSNGLLQGVDVLSGNRKRYRWATSYPLTTYLVFFSTTEYNEFTSTYDYGTGTMPLQFAIYPSSDSPENRASWLIVPTIMDAFRPLYGLYPFINEKYGIYQFEFSGGQEHQTFTGQGGGGAFIDWITAHELAHQWWGDNLTCKTWSDIWLNEGFATYSEALWYERLPGSTGQPALQAAMNARRPGNPNGSVYIPAAQTNDPNRIFNGGITYRKGGWVLHQLRHIVGDATFTNILQTYRMAFEGGAPTTADFTGIASTVAGQDLTWYFQPWLYDVGAPTYQYGTQDVIIGGQHYLKLMINQVQSAAYPRFTMPIDVAVTTGSGINASTTTYVVRDFGASCYFLIPVGANAVSSVTLDPQNWILEYGKDQVSYVAGPPKIVSTTPAPGFTALASAAPSTLDILFSDNVTTAAANFSVTRDGNPVSFAYSYSSVNNTATLNFGSPLAAGAYSILVSDTIVSAATPHIALDGEVATANNPASLPSGNGAAGGIATITFTIQPDAVGSCCTTAGACSITSSAACVGSFTLAGSCAPNPCPQPGACCAADGSCTVAGAIAPGDCGVGVYQGNGSTCSPSPCPQPIACCAPDGSCTFVLSGACSGSNQGVASTCSPNICPQPIACCAADGSCSFVLVGDCSGSSQGSGSVCSPNPCPQPTGACCCGSHCSITTAAGCSGTNRSFVGVGSACTPFDRAIPCCRGDYNHSGGAATVQDIFDFLAGYFASDLCADSNDSSDVSVQDIFDFLAAYFAGCV